jgi:hypothetical protein
MHSNYQLMKYEPLTYHQEEQAARAKALTAQPLAGVLDSSWFPWLLVLGIGWVIFRSPGAASALGGTARGELGRAGGFVRRHAGRFARRARRSAARKRARSKLGAYGGG